jgi:KaiC/GvpD/RAD55 family RecA-like ATPase
MLKLLFPSAKFDIPISMKHPPNVGRGALDKLLEVGISRGHVVEISGPPGCVKEHFRK